MAVEDRGFITLEQIIERADAISSRVCDRWLPNVEAKDVIELAHLVYRLGQELQATRQELERERDYQREQSEQAK